MCGRGVYGEERGLFFEVIPELSLVVVVLLCGVDAGGERLVRSEYFFCWALSGRREFEGRAKENPVNRRYSYSWKVAVTKIGFSVHSETLT